MLFKKGGLIIKEVCLTGNPSHMSVPYTFNLGCLFYGTVLKDTYCSETYCTEIWKLSRKLYWIEFIFVKEAGLQSRTLFSVF